MARMFYRCENFNGDISNRDVSNVESMTDMFAYCENFRQDLSKWNVSAKALLDCEKIFYQCPTNMLEVWNKNYIESTMQKNPNATNKNAKYFPKTKSALRVLYKLENIKLSEIDTSLITDMSFLFMDGVERKDFSGIETRDILKVENFKNMFYDCKNFEQNLDSWKLSEARLKNAMENKHNIFHGTKLENNPPKWLIEEQKIPTSIKGICDLLQEMCDNGDGKQKIFFTKYYNIALQALKAFCEKKKPSDKDLARIYALAMGERDFYKNKTISNCLL